MSILIKGKKMPEGCRQCEFCRFGGVHCELNVCRFTGQSQDSNLQGRMTDCPLIEIPSTDVQPVVHGKWLDLWVEDDEIIGGGFMIKQCSVCKEEMYYGEPRYCPDCGAKMDGET